MSEFFVETFKKQNKCWGCKFEPLKQGDRTYGFCAKHLTAARERWRLWQGQRRAEGKCISCHRKSFRGWLRCRVHREVNRLRIAAWIKAHPDHSALQWEKRKKLLAAGFCPSCKEHRALPAGFRRCDPCRERRRSYGKKGA